MDFHISGVNRANYIFELGKTRSLSGNFLGSTRLLEESAGLYLQQKDYPKYMECLGILLRIYRELQNIKQISAIKDELMNIVWEENIQISARVHYTLGQCALYQGDLNQAQEEFEKSAHQSLNIKEKALEENSQALLIQSQLEYCFSVYGMISLLIRKKDLNSARVEIKSLEAALQSFKTTEKQFSDEMFNRQEARRVEQIKQAKSALKESETERSKLELSTQLLRAAIFRMEGSYAKAENLLWQCYEDVQKSKDLYTLVSFFYYLGQNYMNMRDFTQAGIFLNLAQKSIDSDNFKHLSLLVSECLDKLNKISSQDYDLIVNFSTNSIIEKHKGRVNFKNQFILMDLLKMFLTSPGVSCSKENMAAAVWKQKYDPEAHDNKIYVTIKRLRELVEPDIHHPKYIFRGKKGYYLNEKAKVLLRETPPENTKPAMEEFEL